ncbi:hypothetical protein ACIP93_21395 [Streptomyces sp. NPDC088745]|uniref:hypothetical protein n=1 Tax=Streptomyces sp. NPDC088745 TaxID=3365884 RepID=UPI0038227776
MAEVDLTLLGRTAADWKQTAAHLRRLSAQARSGLLPASERARWDGVNATVTRDFIRRTTKEFADACTEATSIAHVLEDAHQELTKLQKAVRHIRDVEGPKLGMNLAGLPGMAAPSLHPTKPAEIELSRRLKVLAAHAAEIDASVARALRKSHGTDPGNFGHRSYGSLDAAQSERALELAGVGPMLSDAQFTELNSILAFNAKDSDFSTAFYQGLGSPKQALEFYARMSLDCTVGDQPERLALAKDLQRAMGTALASATDPDNRTHLPASWAEEFRALGTQPVPTPALGIDRPYGYQILGGLLRYGDYDPRFINPIAEDILRIHKEDPDFFMETKPRRSDDPDFGFNPSGLTGAGYDPLTSVLEGLGHSPEAAKEFFRAGRHLDDLTSAGFTWAPDTLDRSSEDSHEGGPDALGHALEAATTGHPWDDTRPGLHRDKDTAAIMRKVIELYSPTTEVKPQGALMDSLGRMGAAYIDDLNYSTMDFGGSGDDLGRDEIFARSSDGSTRTAFGETNSRNFMTLVAGDEEGYKSLSSAQQVYAASGLAAQEGDRDTGVSFAHNATKVHGILDAARSHQIAEDFKDDEDQWNLEKEKAGEWRKSAVSGTAAAIAGVGSGLLLGPPAGVAVATAVPVVLEAGAGVVSTAYGTHTLQYLKDTEFKNDPEAIKKIQAQQHLGEREAWIPVSHYADSVGMTRAEKRALNVDIEGSYMIGKQKLDPVRQVS